ncbi:MULTISPECIES: hypothetical protein [Methylocaldum]|uniref:hypothetical protein n=1 Tax=Methylocaldum sp. 14B TaxID=1912213 RepID=UPI00098A224E|nr:hypothetical protein [Methylocaldum sp. 14B]MVF20566.1 hypothetical protein [Methylocaldum sp. BRCS4]
MLGVDDLAALIDGEPITPEVANWLREGLRSAIETGQPLERALRLTELPGRSWRDAVRQRKAKLLVRLAADLIPAPTPWSRAESLFKEIAAFKRYRWSRLQGLDTPPDTLDGIEQHLFGLFRLKNGEVNYSVGAIYAILTKGDS